MQASAPAKLILCGEHAVVYGQPAIAIPVHGIRASVNVTPAEAGSGIIIVAPDLGRRWTPAERPDDPLSLLVTQLIQRFVGPKADQRALNPDLTINISSEIPIASGMGSGAAIATALVRALMAHYGQQLSPDEISTLVYGSEQGYHGTPSGIDNTVLAYEQPIYFVRQPEGRPALIEPITVQNTFQILIADTGIRSATKLPVGELRRRWQANPAEYDVLFEQIGAISQQVRQALNGNDTALGPLLSQNHRLLQQLGVSCPELDRLVAAALNAGAQGAKLSGAGWGGIMIAIVTADQRDSVYRALCQAGAVRVWETVLQQ